MDYSIQTASDASVQPHILEFIKDFYRISDTFGETEKYVDQFTPNATFVVASKKASGHPGTTPPFLNSLVTLTNARRNHHS